MKFDLTQTKQSFKHTKHISIVRVKHLKKRYIAISRAERLKVPLFINFKYLILLLALQFKARYK